MYNLYILYVKYESNVKQYLIHLKFNHSLKINIWLYAKLFFNFTRNLLLHFQDLH